MDLDKNQDRGNSRHKPYTHTRGIDPTPDLPSLLPPPPNTGGDNMDRSPSSSIASPDTATPLSKDYMDFLQRASWKENYRSPKTPIVGRYLDVL